MTNSYEKGLPGVTKSHCMLSQLDLPTLCKDHTLCGRKAAFHIKVTDMNGRTIPFGEADYCADCLSAAGIDENGIG